MASQIMEMTATVVDRSTGPLAKIQQALVGMSRTGGREVQTLNQGVEFLQRNLRSAAIPALQAFGISSLSLTGTIGGLSIAMKGFARDAVALKFFSEDTRLSVGDLEKLRSVANALGFTGLDQAVRTFASHMLQLRGSTRGLTTEAEELRRILGSHGRLDLYGELSGLSKIKDNTEALGAAKKALAEITQADLGQVLSTRLFGTPEMWRVAREEAHTLAMLPAQVLINVEAAQKLNDQMSILSQNFGNIKTTISNNLYEPLTKWIGEFNSFLDKHQGAIGAEIVAFFRDAGREASNLKQIWDELAPTVDPILKMLASPGMGNPGLNKEGKPLIHDFFPPDASGKQPSVREAIEGMNETLDNKTDEFINDYNKRRWDREGTQRGDSATGAPPDPKTKEEQKGWWRSFLDYLHKSGLEVLQEQSALPANAALQTGGVGAGGIGGGGLTGMRGLPGGYAIPGGTGAGGGDTSGTPSGSGGSPSGVGGVGRGGVGGMGKPIPGYGKPGGGGLEADPSQSLAESRQAHEEEMKNPAVRDRMAALALAEGPGHNKATMEMIHNQAAARYPGDPNALSKVMQPKFFEPMRTGKFEQALRNLTPEQRADFETKHGEVMGGSNITDFATGNYAYPGHGFNKGRETAVIGGEHYGVEGPDLPWAEKMKRATIAAQQKKLLTTGGTAPGSPHSERDFQFRENEDAGGKLDKSNIERLDPEFRARLQAMKADMPKELAEAARVNEGHRTRERQSYLWNTRSGRGMVARPGRSRHESGTAVDFDAGPARDWIKGNVGKYGLENLRGDDPHIQINRRDDRKFYDPERLNKAPAKQTSAAKVEGSAKVDFDAGPARDWIKQNVGKYGLENLRGDDPHIQINRDDDRKFYDPERLNKALAKQTSAAKVEGSAKVDVTVGGGNPIRSRAHGAGLFKPVETNRSSQMPHSSDKSAGSTDSAGGEEE